VNGAISGQQRWRRQLFAPVLGLAALAGSTILLFFALAPEPARGQASQRPTITVASTVSVEAAGQVALRIAVGPPDAVPPRSFVRLRGLLPTAALSEGHSIAPGAWAVAVAALPNLKLRLPEGAGGRSEIIITLVSVDGTVLAEARSALVVASAPRQPEPPRSQREASPSATQVMRAGAATQRPPDAIEPKGPAPPTAGQIMTSQDRDRALRLLKRGDQELEEGNVAGARLLYERAADAGLAQAAMALAGTFDESEFARLNVHGIQPDAKEARRWYERARQLGASEAEPRLGRLRAQ
jgi:hypothetical protein